MSYPVQKDRLGLLIVALGLMLIGGLGLVLLGFSQVR